jgi:hypothetical protein
MNLHRDWRKILRRAWSVRLMLLAAVLSGIEAGMPFLTPDWPPRYAAVASLVVGTFALIARFIAQPNMRRAAKKK